MHAKTSSPSSVSFWWFHCHERGLKTSERSQETVAFSTFTKIPNLLKNFLGVEFPTGSGLQVTN